MSGQWQVVQCADGSYRVEQSGPGWTRRFRKKFCSTLIAQLHAQMMNAEEDLTDGYGSGNICSGAF